MSLDSGRVREALQEARVGAKVKSVTFSIPVDHPHAPALLQVFDFLADEIRAGEFVVKKPRAEGAAEQILDALRAAGLAAEVDQALREVQPEISPHTASLRAAQRIAEVFGVGEIVSRLADAMPKADE